MIYGRRNEVRNGIRVERPSAWPSCIGFPLNSPECATSLTYNNAHLSLHRISGAKFGGHWPNIQNELHGCVCLIALTTRMNVLFLNRFVFYNYAMYITSVNITYWLRVSMSVCPFVRLSHARILSTPLNVSSFFASCRPTFYFIHSLPNGRAIFQREPR